MSGGIFNVGSFQTSGIPYLTGSVIAAGGQHTYNFPSVTKRIQVQIVDNTGSAGMVASMVKVHFAPDNVNNRTISNNHWWGVVRSGSINQPLDASIKCKSLYITHGLGTSVQYQIFAELTSISPQDMWTLSGSGITD